jgi:hypothetical protein
MRMSVISTSGASSASASNSSAAPSKVCTFMPARISDFCITQRIDSSSSTTQISSAWLMVLGPVDAVPIAALPVDFPPGKARPTRFARRKWGRSNAAWRRFQWQPARVTVG